MPDASNLTITPESAQPRLMLEIWKAVAATSITRAYSLAVSMAVVMIVARWLGPEGQGTMVAASSWAMLFGTVGSLSMGQVAIHRATIRRGEAWLPETMGTLLALAALVTIVCWVVATILFHLDGAGAFRGVPPLALTVAFLLVPFIVWEFYGSNLLMATNQVAIYNRAQLVGRSAALILIIICWRLRLGIVAALAVSLISQAIVACMGGTRLWRLAGERLRATFAEAKVLLRGALRLHLNALSGYYSLLAVVIVNHYRGPAETGWYQFSASLLNVILVIPLAASFVLSGRIAQRGPDDAWAVQRHMMVFLPLVMMAVGVTAALGAPYAIRAVAGIQYTPAVPVFQLSLFGLLGLTFSSVMSSQWIGRGYFVLMSILSVAVAVIHLTASLLLVPRFGMYGAVYANLITHTLSILGNGIFAWRCELAFRRRRGAACEEGAA